MQPPTPISFFHSSLLWFALVLGLAAPRAHATDPTPMQEAEIALRNSNPHISCARELIRWGEVTDFDVAYFFKKSGVPHNALSMESWERHLEHQLHRDQRQVEHLQQLSPAFTTRLKRLEEKLTGQNSLLELHALFPFALMEFEPSSLWWELLQRKGFSIRQLTFADIARLGYLAEFSRVSLDYDSKTLLVNTLFPDVWLPIMDRNQILDPDTSLIQPLAAAYFQLSLSSEAGGRFIAQPFVEFVSELLDEHPQLEKLYFAFAQDHEDFQQAFLSQAFIIFREKWALEQQLYFYEQALANKWAVHSPLAARMLKMDWENPSRTFITTFSFHHKVHPALVKALWNEALPASLLPVNAAE